jgi:uncharacterized membrane protein
MSYRIVREGLIMLCVVGGAVMGWSAGQAVGGQSYEVIGAFIGMGVLGGFADMCTRS